MVDSSPSLLSFQGVRPVIRSISPRMRRVSCALKAGSISGFPTVLVWVGGAPRPVPASHFLLSSNLIASWYEFGASWNIFTNMVLIVSPEG